MGFRNVSWRHLRRARLCALLASAVSLGATSTAGLAQAGPAPVETWTIGVPPSNPSNTWTVGTPADYSYSTYNGRTAQGLGTVIEYKANQIADKRGFTPEQKTRFVAAAVGTGGAGFALASQRGAQAAKAGGWSAGGAAIGVGVTCLVVAGATTAGFGSPLCALPLMGAMIIGSFAAGATINLFHSSSGDDSKVTNPGSHTGNAQITGSSVPTVAPATSGNATYFAFIQANSTSSAAAAMNNYGLNRTYICSFSGGQPPQYNLCMNLQVPSGSEWSYGTYYQNFSLNSWTWCGGSSFDNCGSQPTMTFLGDPAGMTSDGTFGNHPYGAFPAAPNGYVNLLVYKPLGGTPGQDPIPVVPTTIYQPVQQTGLTPYQIVNNPAMQGKLNQPVSNPLMAGLANETVKNEPDNGASVYGCWDNCGDLSTYSPARAFADDPVTATDVEQAFSTQPQNRPTWGDLARPTNAPGQPVQLGSSTNNVTVNPATQPVTPTNGTGTGAGTGSGAGTGTGTGTGTAENPTYTKETAPTETEKNGIASSIMGPLGALLGKIPRPELALDNVTCPAFTLDTTGMSAKIGLGWRVSTDIHCQIVENGSGSVPPLRPFIASLMIALAMFGAYRRAVSA